MRFSHAAASTYGLAIAGLMCIPPIEEAPAPHFALTAKIAARNGLKLFSMGMSADYPTAIAFGATHVRVGSAIFGAAHLKQNGGDRISGSRARARPHAGEQAAQRGRLERDAARGRGSPAAPHGRTPRCRGRRCAGGCCGRSRRSGRTARRPATAGRPDGRAEANRPVVVPVGRVFAPAIIGPDAPHRQPRYAGAARGRPATTAASPGRRRAACRRRPRACWP